MIIVAGDIETTGLNPDTTDIVEVGFVIDDLSKAFNPDTMPKLHRYILPTTGDVYSGEPYALSMHPQLFRNIATRAKDDPQYINPDEIGEQVRAFLTDNNIKKANFCGKNFASFDLQFLNRTASWSEVKHHYRILDPGSLWVTPQDDHLPDLNECLRRAGLPDYVKHNAIGDAINVLQVVRKKWGLL